MNSLSDNEVIEGIGRSSLRTFTNNFIKLIISILTHKYQLKGRK